MMTIYRTKEEMVKAFLANKASSNGLIHLEYADFERLADKYEPRFSVRVEEEKPFEQLFEDVTRCFKEEKLERIGGMLLCVEYEPDSCLMMEEMNVIHGFFDNLFDEDDDIETLWCLGENKELKAGRAIEIFVFADK